MKKSAQKIKVKGEEKLSFEMEDGMASNVYKNLTSVIEDRLYGVKNVGSGKANKIASTLMSWTTDTMLIFNYYSAIASNNPCDTKDIIHSTCLYIIGYVIVLKSCLVHKNICTNLQKFYN